MTSVFAFSSLFLLVLCLVGVGHQFASTLNAVIRIFNAGIEQLSAGLFQQSLDVHVVAVA